MTIQEFVSKTFAFRDQVHMLHLSTKSYSEHKALGNLYDFILGWLDGFVEAWQGFDGNIDFETIHAEPVNNSVNCVMDYVGVIMAAKGELAEDMETMGFLVNELEACLTELFRTLYKLKNLK